MIDEIRIRVFQSFEGCVFPGDISGYIIPVMTRAIFRAYTGVDNNNNPYLIALTYDGELVVGLAEKGLNQHWASLNSLVGMYHLNKKIGTI